jgi:uncharacterized protein (DUF433 family)
MVVTTDIGTLIVPTSESGKGRPMIAGTGTSVRRVVVLYKQGLNAEEIAAQMSHLNLAQVYAALAYYHANREEIEANLAAEEAEYFRLAALHRQQMGWGFGDYTQERQELLDAVNREDFFQDLQRIRDRDGQGEGQSKR